MLTPLQKDFCSGRTPHRLHHCIALSSGYDSLCSCTVPYSMTSFGSSAQHRRTRPMPIYTYTPSNQVIVSCAGSEKPVISEAELNPGPTSAYLRQLLSKTVATS